MAHQFGFVPFLFVVHHRAVDVGIDLQAFQIILRHEFRIFTPAERRNLPASFAVIGLDLRQALNKNSSRTLSGALVFLHEARAERALIEFPDMVRMVFNGLQLLHAAVRLNIFGDHFIHGLRNNAARHDEYDRESGQ